MISTSHLPLPITSFVGRERELADVCRLLEGNRLVNLTGPGGIGKTRLALQVSATLRDSYPDGVFFVGLAALRDWRGVLASVARALDVAERHDEPLLATLAAYLRDRQLLLVLDNFEQVVDAAPDVTAILAATQHVRVLVTSRAVLRVSGEQEYSVPPLDLPEANASEAETLGEHEAVRLFVDRARAVRPDFRLTAENAPVVAQIVRRLDGLPLALELAAARSKVLDSHTLLERLNRSLPLLTNGGRDRAARHQTLRNAIGWSYELLGPDEQRLFQQLSVFYGGFTLDAAEAVAMGWASGPGERSHDRTADDAPASVLDALDSLLGNSLLVRDSTADGTTRFVILETIREYGEEQLEASGQMAEVQRRHTCYYVALAEQAAPEFRSRNQVGWLRRLAAEHGNLRAVFSRARSAGDSAALLRLAVALTTYWSISGQIQEGRTWLEAALAMSRQHHTETPYATEHAEPECPPIPDWPSLRAHALHGHGLLAAEQSDFETARAAYREALALFREQGDSAGAAGVLLGMGVAAMWDGENRSARPLLEEARARARATNSRTRLADTQLALGYLECASGRPASALELFESGLATHREQGDDWGTAMALVCLGDLLHHKGAVDAAHERYAESLSLQRRLTGRLWVAHALEGLAGVWLHYGLPDRTVRLLAAAEGLRRTIGSPRTVAGRQRFEQPLDEARRRLEASAFEASWAEGRALSVEDAIELALQHEPRSEPQPARGSAIEESVDAAQRLAGQGSEPDALTPRELDVLRLIATGLPNKAVAQRLSLSVYTVQADVSSILSKLRVSSRSAATRYAYEHRLVDPAADAPRTSRM